MRALFSTAMMIGYVAFSAATAHAQSFDSSYDDWSVFSLSQNGGKVCYIASAPVKKTGNYSRRADPYLLVTSRGTDLDEISISSGYPYKTGSKLKVEVDAQKFEFFSNDDLGWAVDEAMDRDVVSAMKRGNKMTVRGVSQKDTFSLDTYSLKGVSKAYNRMKELCQ